MPDRDHAYPYRFNAQTGDLDMVTIGSGVEKGQCAAHIADTPQGAERARPDFGRPPLVFGQGEQGQRNAATLLQSAINTQEPRVAGLYEIVLEDIVDGVGRMTVDVSRVPDDVRTGADSTPYGDPA